MGEVQILSVWVCQQFKADTNLNLCEKQRVIQQIQKKSNQGHFTVNTIWNAINHHPAKVMSILFWEMDMEILACMNNPKLNDIMTV